MSLVTVRPSSRAAANLRVAWAFYDEKANRITGVYVCVCVCVHVCACICACACTVHEWACAGIHMYVCVITAITPSIMEWTHNVILRTYVISYIACKLAQAQSIEITHQSVIKRSVHISQRQFCTHL